MFKPLNKECGKTVVMKPTNATAYVKYQGLGFTSGLLSDVGADNARIEFISLEAKTTGTTDYETLLCLRVDPSIQFEVDLKAAITIANVGTTIDTENGTHLDPTGTGEKIFTITNLVPTNNTKAIGYFNPAIS